MAMTRCVVVALFLTVFIRNTCCQETVLTWRVWSPSGSKVYLNFTRRRLLEFQSCMCGHTTQSCLIHRRYGPHVSLVKRYTLSPNMVDSDTYTSTYICEETHIQFLTKCRRLPKSTCPEVTQCWSFELMDEKFRCELGKVKVAWKSDPFSDLLPVSPYISFTYSPCNENCLTPIDAGGITSVTAISNDTQTRETTTEGEATIKGETTTFITLETTVVALANRDEDDQTYVIVGIVLALIVICVIISVVVGIVLWKRRKLFTVTQSNHIYVNTDAAVQIVDGVSADAIERESAERGRNVPDNVGLYSNMYDRLQFGQGVSRENAYTSLNLSPRHAPENSVTSIPGQAESVSNLGADPNNSDQDSQRYELLHFNDGTTVENSYTSLNIPPRQTPAVNSNTERNQQEAAGNSQGAPSRVGVYSNTYESLQFGCNTNTEHAYTRLSISPKVLINKLRSKRRKSAQVDVSEPRSNVVAENVARLSGNSYITVDDRIEPGVYSTIPASDTTNSVDTRERPSHEDDAGYSLPTED